MTNFGITRRQTLATAAALGFLGTKTHAAEPETARGTVYAGTTR